MGAAPEVLPDAVRFLKVTFLGFLFVFCFFAYQALMRGLGTVYPPMFIVLGTVLLNFLLDPFFIFGSGPIPAMGVAGAAMATLCTQAMAMAIGMGLLISGKHGIELHWADFRPDWRMMGTLLKIGAPASVEQSTQALGMTLMMLLVSTFGTIPIAAYGIGTRVLSCAIIPAMGLSMATSTLVGQNIGAGRLDRAIRTNATSCLISFVTLVTAGLVFFFTGRQLAQFLMPEGGPAIDVTATFISILSISFGFIGLQQVLTGTLRGAGTPWRPCCWRSSRCGYCGFRWRTCFRSTRRWAQREFGGPWQFRSSPRHFSPLPGSCAAIGNTADCWRKLKSNSRPNAKWRWKKICRSNRVPFPTPASLSRLAPRFATMRRHKWRKAKTAYFPSDIAFSPIRNLPVLTTFGANLLPKYCP